MKRVMREVLRESGTERDTGRSSTGADQDTQRSRGQEGAKEKILWQDSHNRRFTSFILAKDQLLAVGHPEEDPNALLS